jgi:O-antigen/teichoic acid export membrane protein
MKPSDPVSTPTAEAGRERDRRLVRGIGAGLVARVISAVAPLVLVPIALNYMGADSYAVWMAAISLTAMAVFADLGLGQGLMTVLTPLVVRDELAAARRAISSAYVLLVGVCLLVSFGVVVMSRYVEWTTILGLGESAPSDSRIVEVCLLGFLFNVPLSLILRVQFACQQVATANLWQASGSILALAAAAFAVVADRGPLAVVIAAVSAPLAANVAASLWFFRRRPELRPYPVIPGGKDIRPLASLGAGYLALNVVMAVAVNLDVVLVSHYEGAAAVVAFALALRIFTQLGSLVSLVNVPLWPVNAEAIERGDHRWIRRTTKRMTLVSATVTGGSALALIVLGREFFHRWTGEPLDVSRVLLLGFALYWTLIAALSPRFMVQNSVGILLPQLVGWCAFLLSSIPVKIYVLEHASMEWMPLAGFGLALVTVLPGCLAGYRKASTAGTGGRSMDVGAGS